MTRKQKVVAALSLPLLLGLFFGYRGLAYLYYRGYSVGVRSGYLRKVATKGPPFCKFVSGELVLQGAAAGQKPEIWNFALESNDPEQPLVKQLDKLAEGGKLVTLKY